MAIRKQQTETRKHWPRYCFIAAICMVALAGILYFWIYVSIDSEFSSVSSYYGERYDELFALSTPNNEVKEDILNQGKAAFRFIGGREECEAFGALSRYCTALEDFPAAARVEFELEQLAGKTEKTEGYLWMAYTYRLYDANGELLSASGSEDQRILCRWTVEKIDDNWQVTEILEHP